MFWIQPGPPIKRSAIDFEWPFLACSSSRATGVDVGMNHGDSRRLYQVVAEQIVFHFLAGDVGQHHAVDFHAGGEGLAGLLHHFRVILAVVDDVDVRVGQTVLAQDSPHAIGPAAGRLEIGFDVHGDKLGAGENGARYRARFRTIKHSLQQFSRRRSWCCRIAPQLIRKGSLSRLVLTNSVSPPMLFTR